MLEDARFCLTVAEEVVSFVSCLSSAELASSSPIAVLELSWLSPEMRFISSWERFLVVVGISGEMLSGGELGGDGVFPSIYVEFSFHIRFRSMSYVWSEVGTELTRSATRVWGSRSRMHVTSRSLETSHPGRALEHQRLPYWKPCVLLISIWIPIL